MTKRITIDVLEDTGGFILETADTDNWDKPAKRRVAKTAKEAMTAARESLGVEDMSTGDAVLPSIELPIRE